MDVELGTNVYFICNTTGYLTSALSYSWRRIDNVFDNPVGRFRGQNTAVLKIADVGVNDANTYVCNVLFLETHIGSATSFLSVIGK